MSLPNALAVVIVLFLLGACTPSSGTTGGDGVPPDYLVSYTSGTVGRDAAVVVTLDTVYPPSLTDLSLEPTVAGELSRAGRQLIFTPADPLPPDTRFTATLSVEGKPDFQFEFATPPRRMELISEGYYLPDPERPERIELRGRILTNDTADPEEVAESIRVTYRDRELQPRVTRQGYRTFTYAIPVEDRGREPSVASLTYGNQGAFAGAEQVTDITILPTGSFELLDVEPGDNATELIARFSGPLAQQQDLTGLVTLNPTVPFTTGVDGNLLYIYPRAGQEREVTITFHSNLGSTEGKTLGRRVGWTVALAGGKPGLRTVGNGSIMPHRGNRYFTFEATGLRAVYVEVFRLQEDNMLQFLQEEALGHTSGEWTLRRVGHTVERRVIPLDQLGGSPVASTWTRYAIDLNDFIGADYAALYQLRLGFGMEHTLESCGDSTALAGLFDLASRLSETEDVQPGFTESASLLGGYGSIYGPGYWEDRDDPCSPAYYGRHNFLIQNVLSSNLGLIAKRNPDRSTLIFTTDLLAAGPRPDVAVSVFSFDQRELATGRTDGSGRLLVTTDAEPAFVRATDGDEVAYLQLDRNDALPLGRFAVEGASAAAGITGAFFAERGVWRPGDSIHLYFVLQDRDGRLPDNYPVQLTLSDARGRVVERRSVLPYGATSGLYALPLSTSADDETGNWTATVAAAGRTYRRRLMIETVKPNRLAVEIEPTDDRTTLRLGARWLYGAPASGLRTQIESDTRLRDADFPNAAGYTFSDPARPIADAANRVIFDGSLNQAGEATFALPRATGPLPGPLSLALRSRVFEPGGSFSVDRRSIPYDPYSVYAGVRLPTSEWGEATLPVEGNAPVDFIAVSPAGVPAAGRRLTVGVYRVGWRYWWQDGNDNVARFGSSDHAEAIESYTVTTGRDGRATVAIGVADWGRYLLRACDEGGHCSGTYFYGGSAAGGTTDRESASLLRLRADREEVETGREVRIEVPSSAGGQLLVSLETAVGSIEQFWVPAQAGQTTVNFRADTRMVPTVYANITLLQPYEQTTNDRPVRLYGVVPIAVTDPTTRLEPRVEVADSWLPQSTVQLTVSEADDQAMTYVINVVDEGLLGLTNFTTPSLHTEFYAKEALAVGTYDVYDEVMSSINGEFGRVLAVGGDGTVVDPEDASANRFPPVVRHLGPFHLSGGSRTHTLDLPNYLGAVRVMVVALNERAYGSTDASVAVRQPLMVLPTLPRVLGPGERVDMAVNLIRTENRIERASVNVTDASGLIGTPPGATELAFAGQDNQLTYLPLSVGAGTGVARLTVAARGGGQTSSQRVELAVRQPNAPETRATSVAVAPGQTIDVAYDPFGLPGSRTAFSELSGLPAMGLKQHLDNLLSYPYGCAEQFLSAALAQLALPGLLSLSQEQEARRVDYITAAISGLRRYSEAGGGIAYWPGQRRAHPWVSSYALHFLIEAERAGFGVPYGLKEDLLKFQHAAAAAWNLNSAAFYVAEDQLLRDQAYRLYGLALAGRADIGAMNRLRSSGADLPVAARHLLAAAYGLIGRQNEGTALLPATTGDVADYRELGFTFGSELRDMALVLESYLRVGDDRAAEQVLRLARAVGDRSYLTTQEAAFVLLALSKVSSGGQTVRAEFTPPGGGAATSVGLSEAVRVIELPVGQAASYRVRNSGTATLYVTTQLSGTPAAGAERNVSRQLGLRVDYTDLNGKPIQVTELASGTEFVATYTVSHPGSTGRRYRQLALTTLPPSGWEISSGRLDGDVGTSDAFTYQDFRDDRVHTFFDLGVGESKTFHFRMTATYPGRYYLPAQTSEAMYDPSIRAATEGRWIEVSKSR
jgi:uncharacterized protein YfaS (alpha-2-macroglobulin family)